MLVISELVELHFPGPYRVSLVQVVRCIRGHSTESGVDLLQNQTLDHAEVLNSSI